MQYPARERFDVVVIGHGQGGYAAAIRAAQLGMTTAVVEKSDSFGGTCLDIGCIPSKTLLDSSELYERLADQGKTYGIIAEEAGLDRLTMMRRKEGVVRQIAGAVAALFKGNRITTFRGSGSLPQQKGDGTCESNAALSPAPGWPPGREPSPCH